MWHVEINDNQSETNIVELTISIADSVFLDYLMERRDLYQYTFDIIRFGYRFVILINHTSHHSQKQEPTKSEYMSK